MSSATISRSLALALLLVCAGCREERTTQAAGVGDPPEAVESLCAAAHQFSKTAEGVALDPDPGFGAARIVWRGDLNGDDVEDLVLRFGDACSGHGECPHAVGAGCDSGGIDLVWGPEYAVELVPPAGIGRTQPGTGADPCDRSWMPLVEVSRDGDATTNRRLCFSGAGYRRLNPPG